MIPRNIEVHFRSGIGQHKARAVVRVANHASRTLHDLLAASSFPRDQQISKSGVRQLTASSFPLSQHS